MISAPSVKRAIAHLEAFGDTDLFPRLPEMQCFNDAADQIADDCSRLNLGMYNPTGVIETLTPKSWLGFRIAHQLNPSDNLIYLAALLDCAPSLEAVRSDKTSNQAFAYRFEEGESSRIFEGSRGYHQWIAYLSEWSDSGNPFSEDRPCVSTDISDFYQRIYFHRIENVLDDAGCPKGPSSLIKKIITTIRARQSFGLPVGTTASRLLAECLMVDTDKFLAGLGLDFTRYVDDIRIIIPANREPHSVLCKLAEHLMVTEGLSLNVGKTKLLTMSQLRQSAKKRLEDVFTSAEAEKMHSFISLSYGEGDDGAEEDAVNNPFLTSEILLNKMGEVGDKKDADLSVFKAILRALRFLPDIDAGRLLDEHAELLYYIPREFCLVLNAASVQAGFDQRSIKRRVLALLRMGPYADLAYVRCWLVNLFVDGTLDYVPSEWSEYNFDRSVIEKRAKIFLAGLADDRPFFRAIKTQIGNMSEWEKSASMLAGMCLPFDEYKNWLDSALHHLASPFAKTYVKWLKEHHGELRRILLNYHAQVPF